MFSLGTQIFWVVMRVCLFPAFLLCLFPLLLFAEGAGHWRADLGFPLSQRVGEGYVDPDRYIWNAYQADDGVLFFGQDRLLRFDGGNWTAMGPESLQILRGITVDAAGRLWIAAFNEVGYFPSGEWRSDRFVSMRSHIPERWRDFGESWDLVFHAGDIWMTTTTQLFRWDGRQFQVWSTPSDDRVIYHFLDDGIYFHVVGEGLFRFGEAGSVLLLDDPELARFSLVHWEYLGDKRFLGVSTNGFFVWDSVANHLQRYTCPVLSAAVVSSVHRLEDGRLFVATLLDGLLVYDENYSLVFHDNEQSGAPSDLITGLYPDQDGGVWAFFSGQLLRMDTSRAAGYLNAVSHLPPGVVRRVAPFMDGFLVATDQGLYQLAGPSADGVVFERISPASMRSDFVLRATSQDIPVVVSVQYGTIYYSDHLSQRVALDTGAYVRGVMASGRYANHYWVLHNQAFSLVRWLPDERQWQVVVSPRSLPIAAEYMVEDGAGAVWFSAPGSALVRGELNLRDDVVDLRSFRDLPGVPLDDRNWLLLPLHDSVAVASRDALVSFRDGSWEIVQQGDGPFLPASPRLFARIGQDRLMLLCRDDDQERSYLIELQTDPDAGADKVAVHNRVHPGLEWVGTVRGMEASSSGSGNPVLHLWGARGILNVDLNLSQSVSAPRRPVLLEWTVDGQPVQMDEGVIPRIGFDYTEMQLAFASPGYRAARPYRYQIRTGGEDAPWSSPSAQTRRDIGRLLEGSYRIEVRAQDANGQFSQPLYLSFQILPPWYRTVWAYGTYMLGIGIGFWVVMYYRERNMRRREQKLEELVAQRTLELEKASRIKSDFIANMSHEIRNPLNGVIGLISRLRPNEAVPERHQQALRRAAHYLQTTVEEVLDFSRIESGHIELNLQSFDPEAILEGVIEIYSERAVAKKLQLTFSPRNPGGWHVLSDPSKIQQIAGNLVSNAVKFTHHGGVHLGLSIDAVNSDEGWLKFWVSDTGPGIPSVEQDKVFQKYYQIQREGDDSHRAGTGLGLSLCQDFVARLGGSMHLFSEQDEGTTFTVTLPVRLMERPVEAPGAGALMALPHLRVLVVEDLEYNRLYLEDWLREKGCEVTTCMDGESGYAEAARGDYDLVFLDWDLPQISGLEVARRLRLNAPALATTRIVGMTAFATMETRKACLDAGMDAFITKPLSEERLLAVLHEVAQGVPARVSVPESSTVADLSWEVLERTSRAKGVTLAAEFERFLNLLDGQLDSLRQALDKDDLPAVRSGIHAALGHSGLIRPDNFTDALRDLQVAAMASDKVGVDQEWQCLIEERKAFDAILEKLGKENPVT